MSREFTGAGDAAAPSAVPSSEISSSVAAAALTLFGAGAFLGAVAGIAAFVTFVCLYCQSGSSYCGIITYSSRLLRSSFGDGWFGGLGLLSLRFIVRSVRGLPLARRSCLCSSGSLLRRHVDGWYSIESRRVAQNCEFGHRGRCAGERW
jgi:hypothetical protein